MHTRDRVCLAQVLRTPAFGRTRRPRPMWTLDEYLSELELPPGSNVAVLTLLGSLCPITRGHVSAFTQARAMLLDEQTGTKRPANLEKFEAVIGLISPNKYVYVQRKLEQKGQPVLMSNDRDHLCELAITDYPWLNLVAHEGLEPGMRVTDHPPANIAELRIRWPSLCFQHFVLSGADDVLRFSKYTWYAECDAEGKRYESGRMICLGRPGFTETVIKQATECGIDLDNGNFIMGPELPDISSTDARIALNQGDTKKVLSILEPKVSAWCIKYGPWQPVGRTGVRIKELSIIVIGLSFIVYIMINIVINRNWEY